LNFVINERKWDYEKDFFHFGESCVYHCFRFYLRNLRGLCFCISLCRYLWFFLRRDFLRYGY
jgi:hypothetical protein